MNRKINISGAIFLLVCLISACEDFLTKEPVSDLTKESFWESARDAEIGVVAIYNAFATAMSPGLWNWGELRSDNFGDTYKDAQSQNRLLENQLWYEDDYAGWTNLYSTISKANAAIKYIPRISMNTSDKNHLLAEAYAIRAWAYFYCIRVWGDVPLYTEPVESVEEGIYRERTDKDYIMETVILPDIEKAYYLINKTVTDRKRMNVATVCALSMDIYAWLHDYESVVKIMEERASVLSSTYWGLTALNASTFPGDWRAMFWEDNTIDIPKEVFFKIAYDREGNGENWAMRYFATASAYVSLSGRVTSLGMDNSLYDIVDMRYRYRNTSGTYVTTQWSSGSRFFFVRKFWDDSKTVFSGTGKDFSDNDLVLYRYADLVLLYAEALNALDRTQEAVDQLNRIHTRAGNAQYFANDFPLSDDLLDAILDERQREFLGEGKRWFDLVRTDRWAQHSTLTDARKILFPIHRDHLLHNYNLKQNPGYID